MKHFFLGRTKALHIQFLRYFFVGGTSAIVDLLIFTVLVKQFGIHYLLAAFIAYMLGLIWNHVLSVLWVFESKHARWKEILMVFLIALGGLFWTEVILYGLVEYTGLDAVIAKMLSQIIVLFWNFGMRKVYVFH